MIISFLNKQGGGGYTEKALASAEVRQTHSLLKDRCPIGASLGAPRLAKLRLSISYVSATLPKVGREKVGKIMGENKGQSPLGKWLRHLDLSQRGNSKAKDEEDGGEVRSGLGPGVSSLRSKFEARGAVGPKDKGLDRDQTKPRSKER